MQQLGEEQPPGQAQALKTTWSLLTTLSLLRRKLWWRLRQQIMTTSVTSELWSTLGSRTVLSGRNGTAGSLTSDRQGADLEDCGAFLRNLPRRLVVSALPFFRVLISESIAACWPPPLSPEFLKDVDLRVTTLAAFELSCASLFLKGLFLAEGAVPSARYCGVQLVREP